MKIKLLKSYLLSGAGEIIEPSEPVADLLIRRGIAEKIVRKKKKKAK